MSILELRIFPLSPSPGSAHRRNRWRTTISLSRIRSAIAASAPAKPCGSIPRPANSAYTPDTIRFRDGDKIRPVAPFLEVFARTGADVLEPLTVDLLKAESLSPSDLRWTVKLGNIGGHRRTGDENDEDRGDRELRRSCGPSTRRNVRELFTWQDPAAGFGAIHQAVGAVSRDKTALHAGEGARLWRECRAHQSRCAERPPRKGPRRSTAGSILDDRAAKPWRGYFDQGLPSEPIPAHLCNFIDQNGNPVSSGLSGRNATAPSRRSSPSAARASGLCTDQARGHRVLHPMACDPHRGGRT